MEIENDIDEYPTIVSLDKSKKIIKQIEECICKIYMNEGGNGTGFFCYITDISNNNKIPVMITNNHIIDENDFKNNNTIKISFNNDKKYQDIILDSKRKKYTNKDLDITIIEINKEKDNINSFLEIDEKIYQNNSEVFFNKKSAYVIQYPKDHGASVSYGVVKEISEEKSEIHHLCNTNKGSSGAPILNLENNKVIGVHKGFETEYKTGTFLKCPINEFFSNKPIVFTKKDTYKEFQNEITITLKIEQSDLNNEVYFLDNTNEFLERIQEKGPHSNLTELNQNNTELFINKEKHDYTKFWKFSEEGIYEIKLKFKNYINDCSYMFYYCKNMVKVDFSLFKTNNVTNMSHMFCYCNMLTDLDLSLFNTEKVTNMSYLFAYCSCLKNINLSSFNIQNVSDMENMFAYCIELTSIDISSFIPSANLNCNDMFKRCRLLKKIKYNKKGNDKFNNEIEDIEEKVYV